MVLGAVALALTAVTWRKWPDLIIDFGVQLYVPWKISQGAVLYRDIPYLTGGPLSQYFDSLVFRIFGASVLTLVWVNLGFLAALLAIVYRQFHRAAGQWVAMLAGLSILLGFAFAQYSEHGVFNYVTPYSEEIYQGLVLAALGVMLLARWAENGKAAAAAGAGLCLGLVFLTKAEVFLALAAAALAALFCSRRSGRKWLVIARASGIMMAAGVAPCLGFLAGFLRAGNWRQSIAWTCWAWTPLLTTKAADSPFYRWCLGLDAPWRHARQALIDFVALAAVLTLSAAVLRRWKGGMAWLALATPLTAAAYFMNWQECGLCLPLVCVTTLWLLWRRRAWPLQAFPMIWAVFSLTLLAKLGLYCRIWHYGFVLAMPAFLLGVYLLLKLLPQELERRGVPSEKLRSLCAALLAIGLLQLILGSKYIYQKKTIPVAGGADLLWTFPPEEQPEGAGLALADAWLQTNSPANSTLAVLPQGAMLNFLLRRDNPARYVRWNPPELAAFGQSNMTRVFEEHPPDYVATLGLDNGEFGARFLGDTPAFGQELMQWIAAHYEPACSIGDDWTKTGRFGVKISKRKDPGPQSGFDGSQKAR